MFNNLIVFPGRNPLQTPYQCDINVMCHNKPLNARKQNTTSNTRFSRCRAGFSMTAVTDTRVYYQMLTSHELHVNRRPRRLFTSYVHHKTRH